MRRTLASLVALGLSLGLALTVTPAVVSAADATRLAQTRTARGTRTRGPGRGAAPGPFLPGPLRLVRQLELETKISTAPSSVAPRHAHNTRHGLKGGAT